MMFDGRTGPDPFVDYKMHHVWRAEQSRILSEDLGLYEALREGPASVEEVCRRTGLQPRPAAILLSANACMGILGVEQGRYFIYEIQREFVLEGGRARWRPRIPAPGKDPRYDGLKQAALTNQPVPEALPDWLKNPQGGPGVTAHVPQRHHWRILWGEALARAFDFSPYRLIVDLGGATGGILVGLTAQYPELRGLVFDLPYSRGSAEAAIKGSDAEGRVGFACGDFFTDPYPEGADLFFMSHVIHDWDDERCLLLLRRCCEALPAGSPVMAMEFLLNEDKTGSLLAVFQWFGLLDSTPGDQRTAGEIAALMEKAGFRGMEIRPVDTEHSIVIGWKR
jgi:hypothetical protein